MSNVFRPSSFRRVLLCALAMSTAGIAIGQTAQVSLLQRQLSHVDIGISGAGEFTNTVTGTNYLGQTLTQKPSNTLGALITVRYTKSPLIGFEFNYGYARYTQNYSNVPGPNGNAPLGVQAQTNEYTLGYVIQPAHSLFGFQPFVSAGAGTMAFKPTARGGLGLSTQARATYYYNVGLQQEYLSSHFGLRASFRQQFFLAPDFGQNYLTIKQRTTSTEPTIGFYLKF